MSVLAAAALVPLAAFAGCWRRATSIERGRDDSRGVVMIRSEDFRDDDLWSLFEASASGELSAVKRLVEARPELVDAQCNYTPAIHFAVREGAWRWRSI